MSLPVSVRRLALNAAGAALLAASGSLIQAQGPAVNNPPLAPRSILVFPQRDFVSSSGFDAGDLVTIEVFHPGTTTAASTAPNVVPQDDPATPAFDGIVEVNHPGGACWATVTPDIRPGDRVRTTRRDALGTVLGIDETTVANVVAQRPIQTGPASVEIHGTAVSADGVTPIAIGQLEQRLIAPRDAFEANGRRTLRADSTGGNDGTLSYDAPGSTAWTARYIGLSAADVTRALNAESRIMWLGAAPPAGVEGTIYEIGAGITPGPSAPCTAPLEKLPPPPGSELVPPSAPADAVATVSSSNTISLRWTAATDNVGVTSYGIYRNGIAIANVENPDATAPAPTFFDDLNVPPGTYTYTIDAADAVGNRSAAVGTTPTEVTAAAQQAQSIPLCTTAVAPTCVSEPPAANPTQVQIIPFPARDFTSSSGYTADVATVAVQVIRNGYLISTASLVPQDDPTTPEFDGIVEINHPGGGCWVGVTPDIRANDIVRQIAYASDGSVMRIDQTHVANVSVERPQVAHPASSTSNDGVVVVHGTAQGVDGAPIALDQLNQRLVAPRDRFDFNGRRTLRAGPGEEFVLEYDATNNPDGTKFTATYSGLNENDVYRAVGGTTSGGRTFAGAESRILFLGLPTVVAPEITIYENSDATESGPSAGFCAAPLEPLDVQPPLAPSLTLAPAGASAHQLTWTASTDDTYVYGYGIYRDGARIANVAGSVTTYVDQNVPAGDHTYSVDAVDSASPLKVNYPEVTPGPNTGDPILQGVPYGNRSAMSNQESVGQPDVTAPTVPTNLVAVVQANGIQLKWLASSDDVGVVSYGIYRDGVLIGSATGTQYVDAMTTPGSYAYAIDAADAAGNRSAASAPVTVVVTTVADVQPPSRPANLAADTRDIYTASTPPAIGPRDVSLSWAASTDDSGVAGYAVYRRPALSLDPAAAFTKIADVNGATRSFVDRNVAVGTYDYTVDAVDSAGNRSPQAPIAANVVTVNDPPQGTHSIIPFPARDFVSSSGYAVSEGPITVSVIRGGKVWARSVPIAVVEDPATPGLGAAEVNHPGGGCWDIAQLDGLDGITPDLRPGDIVRFTNRFGKSDQTTTANVWADRPTDRAIDGSLLPPGTVQVHGYAQDALGNPLPIDQLEHRLVSSSAVPFDSNGRRTLRAPGDGTIAYDPVEPTTNPRGTRWTATYRGLTLADVDLAKAAESRAVWLGRDPLAGVELTIFENGDGVAGGPAAGVCDNPAPAEAGPAVTFDAPAPFAASFDPGVLTLTFPTQGTGTSATQTLVLTNIGTADPARAIAGTLQVASVNLQAVGEISIVSNTCSGATLPISSTCAVALAFSPTTPGFHTARLLVSDDANNSPVQAIAISGGAFDAQAPTVTAPKVSFVSKPPASVTATAVAVNVVAQATDASGVASMTLEQSTDGGRTWKPVSPAATVALVSPPAGGPVSGTVTATLSLTLSATYQFRAIATDTAQNTSAAVGSGNVRMILTDDGAATPRYSGSWSTQRNNAETAATIASTLHIATAPPAGKTNTVSFTFTGTEVALVSSVGPDRGQVSLSLDGGAPQVVDLYAPGAVSKAVVVGAVSAAASGTHTVTVSVQPTKNPSSSGTRVDVDAFVVK